MAGHIAKDRRDPRVDYAIAEALGARGKGRWAVPENDPMAELRAIYNYARRKVRYTSDAEGLDTFRRPRRTLELGIGDCDDVSALIGAMASGAGYPVGLKVIQTGDNDDYNHVYNVIGLPAANPTRWIPIDGTQDRGVGWEAQAGVTRSKAVRVESGKITDLATADMSENPWIRLVTVVGVGWLLHKATR